MLGAWRGRWSRQRIIAALAFRGACVTVLDEDGAGRLVSLSLPYSLDAFSGTCFIMNNTVVLKASIEWYREHCSVERVSLRTRL